MASRYPWNTSEEIAAENHPRFETPQGAQVKANQAEQNAKQYSDQELEKFRTQPELNISNGSIVNRHLRDESVTTSKLAQKSVTQDRIATGAVGRQQVDPELLQDYNNLPVATKLNELDARITEISVNVKSFGAVGDGTTDDYSAFMAAHNSLPATGGTILVPNGVFRITQGLVFEKRVRLVGNGYSTNEGVDNYAPSCILIDGAYDAITLKGAGSIVSALQVIGKKTGNKDGVVIAASRCVIESVSVMNMGRDGLRIGTDTGSNCNLWRVNNLIALGNVRHGMYVHHGIPGLPDTNAGTLMGMDARVNGGDGIALGNTIDNSFYGICCQSNAGYGVHLYTGAMGNKFFAQYCEANVAGEFILDAGTKQNMAFGSRQGTVSDGYVNNGSLSNLILGSDGQQADYPFYFRTPISMVESRITNTAISGIWRRYQNETDRSLIEVISGTSATPVSIKDAHEAGGLVTREVMQLRIGSGSIIKAHYYGLGTRDLPNIPAHSTAELNITVTGAAVGDMASASPNTTLEAGIVYGGAWVSAANTVTVRLGNVTPAAIDPVSRGWYVEVWRH